jgi:hypothetical protein
VYFPAVRREREVDLIIVRGETLAHSLNDKLKYFELTIGAAPMVPDWLSSGFGTILLPLTVANFCKHTFKWDYFEFKLWLSIFIDFLIVMIWNPPFLSIDFFD